MNRLFVASLGRSISIILVSCAAVMAFSHSAHAQVGQLSGRVTDADNKEPLIGATVRVNGVDVTSRRSGAITDRDGRYRVKGLAPGQYSVLVSTIGYTASTQAVTVEPGASAILDAQLKPGSIGMNEVVVTASRKPEKVTDAPA